MLEPDDGLTVNVHKPNRQPMTAQSAAPARRALHPSVEEILRWFDFDHLPPRLQDVSRPIHDLAHKYAQELEGSELTTGLRKLLEAKDALVRAALR